MLTPGKPEAIPATAVQLPPPVGTPAGQEASAALQRLTSARARMLLDARLCFFGHLCLHFELVVTRDPALATAATDGTHVWFDQDFLSRLDDDGLEFVLAHETLHVALRHTRRDGLGQRLEGAYLELANIAADYVVNGILAQSDFKVPAEALREREFDDLAVEVVYRILLGKVGRILEPGMSPNAVLERVASGRPSRGGQGPLDHHGWWGVAGDDDGEIWRGRITAARMAAKSAMPPALEVHLSRILYPELPWRDLLRQNAEASVPGDFRWHPASRRHIWRGLHLPATAPTPVLEVDVYIDVSGSIDRNKDFPEFVGGVMEMCESFVQWHLRVSQFDTAILATREYATGDILDLGHWLLDGGGTDFQACIDHAFASARKPHQVLIYTDGADRMPTVPEGANLLWIVSQNGLPDSHFTVGRVIRLPRRD